jgi:signal transduction histidine kinase
MYDIDLLINRAIVYLVTSIVLIALCVALIPLIASTVSGTTAVGSLVLLTGCLVLVVDPLRRIVQRALDHALRGDRNDPHAAIARLGRTIVSTSDASQLLTAIAENIRTSLRLPYAAVFIQRGEELLAKTETGRGGILPTTTLAMKYHGEPVGRIVVAQRSEGEPFSSKDIDLLGELAGQAGIAAHAALLALEIQGSRERLRRELEEERRKWRHDLHDSLGPMLAGLVMQAGAGKAEAHTSASTSTGVLEVLELGLRRCMDEVRLLINDLHRPAALDQIGLVGAIQESVGNFQNSVLSVTVESFILPELPAAVEVAAYRIVNEALTNVVKHAHAHHAKVELRMHSGVLRVCVIDDGVGMVPNRRLGEGLLSMRERASELGGHCDAERLSDGGTRVTASLPVRTRQIGVGLE